MACSLLPSMVVTPIQLETINQDAEHELPISATSVAELPISVAKLAAGILDLYLVSALPAEHISVLPAKIAAESHYLLPI